MQILVSLYMLIRSRKHVLSVIAILLLSMGNLFTQTALAAPVSAKPYTQQTTFILDGVTVTVDTPFLPGSHFSTSKPGDPTQTAVATTSDLKAHPYGAISMTAVPYGTKPTTEGVPVAQAGGVQAYRTTLYQYRVHEGDNPQPGPGITIFGQRVPGEVSLMQGNVKVAYSSTTVGEWVAEAGKRLWIVRITETEPQGVVNLTMAAPFLASLSSFVVSSNTLSHPTTVKIAQVSHAIKSAVLSSYPFPSWWSSTCNDKNGVSPAGSYSMANWHGIDACGPVATANTSYFGGLVSSGVLEWQCVELVQRYFIMAGYLTNVYPANGNQIVNAYPNSNMQKINNGTPGSAPQPGDVLSYDGIANNPYGHTSLVTGSSVNSSGNGTITVLQQNSYYTNSSGAVITIPTDTLKVGNWHVTYGFGVVINWLHDPSSGGSGSSGGGSSTPPALQSASPTLITFSGGQRELVAVGSDGHIWHAPISATDTGSWGAWNWLGSTGGFANATPTLMTFADGQRELIAVGQDGHIWHTPIPANDTGSWGAWNWTGSTGGFAAASPTVITYADGSMELIAIGQDGHIWHTPQELTDTGVWGQWDWLGSTGGFAAASPTLIKYASGTLELIAVGQDGHIWHDPIPAVDNGTWGQWDWLGSTGGFAVASPTLINYADGTLELIAVGQDGHIWHDPIPTVDNGTWGTWNWTGSTGGFTNASPMLIKYADGTLELTAISQDGHIWHEPIPAVDNGTWGQWDWLGSTGGFTNASPMLVSFSNGWELIAIGQDGHVWHNPIPTVDNGTWGRWDWLGSTGGFV